MDRLYVSHCSCPSDWLTERFPVWIQRKGERGEEGKFVTERKEIREREMREEYKSERRS